MIPLLATHTSVHESATPGLRRLVGRFGLCILAMLLILGASVNVASSQTTGHNPVGTWRLYSGGGVTTTVYFPNGDFMLQTRKGSIMFTSWGRYEIRGNVLTVHYTGWSPAGMWNVDGSYTPIYMPASESMWFRVLDANRVETPFGVAVRISHGT